MAQFTCSHTLTNRFLLHVQFSTFAFFYVLEIRKASYLQKERKKNRFISEALKQLDAEFDEQLGHELLMKLA